MPDSNENSLQNNGPIGRLKTSVKGGLCTRWIAESQISASQKSCVRSRTATECSTKTTFFTEDATRSTEAENIEVRLVKKQMGSSFSHHTSNGTSITGRLKLFWLRGLGDTIVNGTFTRLFLLHRISQRVQCFQTDIFNQHSMAVY